MSVVLRLRGQVQAAGPGVEDVLPGLTAVNHCVHVFHMENTSHSAADT